MPPANLVAADAERVNEWRHRWQLGAVRPVTAWAAAGDQVEVLSYHVRRRLLPFQHDPRHRVEHGNRTMRAGAGQRERDLEPRWCGYPRFQHEVVVHLDQVAVLPGEAIGARAHRMDLPALHSDGADRDLSRLRVQPPRGTGQY